MTTQEKINSLKEEISQLEIQLEKEKNDPKLFLLELIGNELTIKIDREKYPNSVFYFKGGACLLELEKSDGTTYLWCNYSKFWNPISEKFSLGYAEIKILIKETVEEHFKMRDVTPALAAGPTPTPVEEHFKMRDVTPKGIDRRSFYFMDLE
ncbi:DUF342 domain-containing protein [Chryseobacterium gallinarum]|uniref:DUF342 domain-containing protein n=1 Tax=Chryseobacterium gallinarum TaxID=1324352 RepID=A0ABX6KUB7_CHRGL|nr:DUF342 domain-containing protein [Chryseobacterium gallinarum]QIY92203.1 DUF342 domain-containing protein [Chryseobacterium gallinarum]